MKINLPLPGSRTQRLLFSNAGQENPNEFYLLMTFHKSKKGGFDVEISVADCQKALRRKNKQFVYVSCK